MTHTSTTLHHAANDRQTIDPYPYAYADAAVGASGRR